MSAGTISRQMCISERSVTRYPALFQQTGDVPKTQRHGLERLLGDFEQLGLLQLILENTGIYLHELQERFYSRFGVTISVPTICRTLRHMGCSRRVICYIALQRSDELRAKFMAEMRLYDADMFIWIDKSGCDRRNSTRKLAYIIRGVPPVDHRILSNESTPDAFRLFSSLC